MAAFEAAIRAGASAVEMDLRSTLDRETVVCHDPTVDRTTNGSGSIHRLTLKQVQQLDAGSWFSQSFAGQRIPMLRQVVDQVLPRIPCVLHVKASSALVVDAVATIRPASRHRVTVSSARLSTLARLEDTGVYRTWITYWRHWPGWTALIVHLARRRGINRLAAKGSTVTPTMVKQVHRSGLMIRAWGVGDDAQMARRLLSTGIDGMTFDDPAHLGTMLQTV